jgi:hypothetical protein
MIITNELWIMWKEAAMAYPSKKSNKTLFRVVGRQAENWTQAILNMKNTKMYNL